MRSNLKIWATLLAVCPMGLVLPGCAPSLKQAPVDPSLAAQEAMKQRELALDLSMRRADRLRGVSYPLRRAATGLCNDEAKDMGVALHDVTAYPKEYRKAAVSLFGVGEVVQVRYVQPGFPVADAGLALRDTVVAIDGHEVGRTEDAIERLSRAAHRQDSVLLSVGSATGRRDVFVRFVPVARYPVHLAADDIVNAYADGANVYVATGMLRFAESDEELALVVGHELAHNCLGHLEKMTGNWLLGTLIDAVIYAGTGVDTGNLFGEAAAQTFSKEFESEADYMGLYLVKRAGFGVSLAPQFWRRMTAEHPGSIKQNFTASHPSTPERFLALENAVAEIERKVAAGEPLVPEKR